MYNPCYIHNFLAEFRFDLYRKCVRVIETTLHAMEEAGTAQCKDHWQPTASIRCVNTEQYCTRSLSTLISV